MTMPTTFHPTRVRAATNRVRRVFSMRGAVLVVGVFALLIVIYYTVVWEWMATWGATRQEIAAQLPGDELVPTFERQTTQAVTIHAAPQQIYPWLLQLGVDRGGMYSYDWLENLFGLNVHTIDWIDPKYQDVRPGDFWGFTPPDYAMPDGPGIHVVRVDPQVGVIGCMSIRSKPPPPCTATFQLVMQPQSDGATRLILRSRTSADSPLSGWFGKAFDAVAFVMQRGMLLGFRDRIEGANR